MRWLNIFHKTLFESWIQAPGFDLSVWNAAVIIYPFATLCWINKNLKLVVQQISPAHRTIYFPQLLTEDLSETIISRAQPPIICSNSKLTIVEYSEKYFQS